MLLTAFTGIRKKVTTSEINLAANDSYISSTL